VKYIFLADVLFLGGHLRLDILYSGRYGNPH